MNMRDLIPWSRSSSQAPSPYRGGEASPFVTLHREMNRLFEDILRGFDTPALAFGRVGWPSVEAVETDKDVRISAELPGMDEKDVEVLVDGDVLTIRGEKKAEMEDKDCRFSERYYGRFERRIPLPFEIEEDKVEASFKNGVLTVTLLKSVRAQEKARRVPISNKDQETRH